MKKITLLFLLLGVFMIPGLVSAQSSDDVGCLPGYVYSYLTGQKCSSDPSLPVGCTSTSGYSPITGQKCDYEVEGIPLPAGCASREGYSVTTGQKCDGEGIRLNSSITVLSPNGGETWKKYDTQRIQWKDNEGYSCPVNAICDPARKEFDIYVYYSCPPGYSCPAVVHPVYTIAKNVSAYSSGSYSWSVGKTTTDILSDGTYKIQVCRSADKNICGFSDSYFKITSFDSSAPTISGVSGPTSLAVSEKGEWKVVARGDGRLTYSVSWGDQAIPLYGATDSKSTSSQSATFTHTYYGAGTYHPTFTVTNENGQSAETSLSVKVGGSTPVNTPPKFSGGTAIPEYIETGEAADFSFKATDADGDDLFWSIVWGDGTGQAGACPVGADTGARRNWKYAPSHTWNDAGQYKVDVSVSDCKGGNAYQSFSVKVGSGSSVQQIGDVDGNGRVEAYDAALVKRYVQGLETFYEAQKTRADANANGKIANDDACLILNYVVGKISKLPYTAAYSECMSPDVSITANPRSINSGDSTIVTWVSLRAETCALMSMADGPGASVTSVPKMGSRTFYPTVDTEYTIKCGNSNGEKDAEIEISVTKKEFWKGDVDNNGSINCDDTNMILKAAVGSISLNSDQKERADVNEDGRITATDAQILLSENNLSCGLVSSLPTLSANALSALDSATSPATIISSPASSSCVFTMTLRQGMDNEQVKCLQKMLGEKGFKVQEAGLETTYFGETTVAALKAFQGSKGLKTDGIFGAVSRAALAQ